MMDSPQHEPFDSFPLFHSISSFFAVILKFQLNSQVETRFLRKTNDQPSRGHLFFHMTGFARRVCKMWKFFFFFKGLAWIKK